MTNVSVDPLALKCVRNGLIDSLHVRIDKLGFKTMMVPGKSLIGSGPFHSFKKYDLDLALTYIRENSIVKDEPVPTPPSSPVTEKGKRRVSFQPQVGIPSSVEEATALQQRFVLRQIKRNGVMNILPRDSITRWEFSRPDPLLVARIILVAKDLGEAKAVSRITSDLSMRIDGASTLFQWWDSASSEQKWRLLSSRKYSGEAKEGLPDDLNRLLSVECPFKDTHIEVETLDSEGEESSYGGVSFASY